MKITNTELNVVRFASEDVIATSGLVGKVWQFFIPSSQYGDGTMSGEYVMFNGTVYPYGSGPYEITNIYDVQANADNDRNGMMTGTIYIPEYGITLPSTALDPIAKQTYDAYSYGDGKYYTNGGASYYEMYRQ